MMDIKTEKRLLQIVVAIGCLVPLFGGLSGTLQMNELSDGIDLDSHFRYLSGLLLGIGLGFLSCIPHIERHTERFRTLALIVVIGGLCRLIGGFLIGLPHTPMIAALAMELLVMPLLCWWQSSVAARYNSIV